MKSYHVINAFNQTSTIIYNINNPIYRTVISMGKYMLYASCIVIVGKHHLTEFLENGATELSCIYPYF